MAFFLPQTVLAQRPRDRKKRTPFAAIQVTPERRVLSREEAEAKEKEKNLSLHS